MKAFVVAASCLLVVASPAFAQEGTSPTPGNGAEETAGAPQNATSGETGQAEHLVCRRIQTEGSRRMASRSPAPTRTGRSAP